MKNIKPCPYCDGEVEMVKLKNDKYRIDCKRCHALVAKGRKFDIESVKDGEERIKEYNEVMKTLFPVPENKNENN